MDGNRSPEPHNVYSLSLGILCLTGFLTTVDRLAFPVVLEPIRHEFALTDTQIGLLTGIAYSAMYAFASIPVARWADAGDRRFIIALSIGIWSVMTAICGLAQSAWQLFVLRFGVGIGDAGSNAPVQALISDYYRPDRRSLPLSLFGLGAALGGILGYVIVGMAAERLGWRVALMLLGVPGLLVAALIRLFVIEPRVTAKQGHGVRPVRPPFVASVVAMFRKRSFAHLSVGFAIWGIASAGSGQWLPMFLIRTYGLSLTQVGLLLGLLVGSSLCVGLLLGGIVGNRLLPRDMRWGLRLPAIGMSLYALVTFGALISLSLRLSLGLLFVGGCVGGLVVAPLLATVSGLVQAEIRALSLAVMGLLSALIGGGFGPFAIGMLSDRLQGRFGAESLRLSLACACIPVLWGAWHFYLASRYLPDDLEGNSTSRSIPLPQSR